VSTYIPISNLVFQSTFDLLLSTLQIKLLPVLRENWSVKLSRTKWHTLFFSFLKIWYCGLLCWVVMLASCTLETSPTMPSWGKLSTLHFLFELISWSFVYGYSRCEMNWESCGIMEFVFMLEKCLGRQSKLCIIHGGNLQHAHSGHSTMHLKIKSCTNGK
jgi:hypothetical protein